MGRRKGDRPSAYKKVEWDGKPPEIEYFEEIQRICKHFIIFGANHFIQNIKINSSCWIIWDKGFSENVSFASFEMALTNFDSPSKRICLTSAQNDRIHPTQKPVKLYEWILTNYAKTGDKVLDTHVGSASSLIDCHNLGYDYIGFEIDKEYYDMANTRLESVKAQMKMF